ncbi:MAG: tetratricopeptide repeat protein [Pirellulaceae bacterium]
MQKSTNETNTTINQRRWRWIVCVVGLLLCTGCTSFRQRTLNGQLESERLIQNASELTQLGREDSAERLLLKSLEYTPENTETHQRLARLYWEKGEVKKAVNQLNDALDAGCQCPSVHTQLGRYYLESGQFLAAKRQSELGIELSQQSADAWELAGDVAKAQSRWSDALNAYHRATGCIESTPGTQLKICEIYRLTNRPLRALSTIEQVIADYPTYSVPQEVLVMHGILLTEVENYSMAIEQLGKAAGRDDATPEAFLRLSHAQLLSGNEYNAEATLVLGQERFPNAPVFDDLITQVRAAGQPQLTDVR